MSKIMTKRAIYAEEDALIDFQFALLDAMKEREVSQSQLAELLGVSRARISQLLSSDANPTIKLAGRALAALALRADYVPLAHERRTEKVAEVPKRRASGRRMSFEDCVAAIPMDTRGSAWDVVVADNENGLRAREAA